MPGFVDLEVTTTEEELVDRVFEALETSFPGYEANDAHLDSALITELARMVTEALQVMSQVAPEIFRGFGQKLVGLAPIDGARAGTLTTWTAIDNAGYTIPAGTRLAFRIAGDELILFETTAEAVIPAGSVNLANVPIQTVEVGDQANGIAAGSAYELVDALSFITGIVSTTISSGGVDAETDDAYLDRLSDYLTLLTPEPILAPDFAVLARNVAGVHRATAVDNYNPADQTLNNERMVAVAAVDASGLAVSQAIKDQIKAYLEDKRETNFIVNVFDPTYNELDIVFTAVATKDADPAAVEAAAEQAVRDYIDPKKWAGGDADPPRWDRVTVVRYLELAQVINDVPGIDHITTTGGNFDLTINGGRADVALAGQAPLPKGIGVDVAATLVTGVEANNNAIRWTADTPGAGGNAIRIAMVNAGVSQALAVAVAGNDITVTLATDAGGLITSTAQQVIDAVNAHAGASALVTAANQGASTGAGVVTAVALTNLAGGEDFSSVDGTVVAP